MALETAKIPRPGKDETPPRNTTRDRTSGARKAATGEEAGTGERSRVPPRSSPNTKSARMDAQIKESLLNLYGTIGLATVGIGQVNENPALVAAGVNVTVQAPDLCDTWIEVGNQVPAIRKWLESMLTGTAIATLAMQHLGLVAPIVAALGFIPFTMGEIFLAPEAKDAAQQFAAARNAAHAAANGQPAQPTQ